VSLVVPSPRAPKSRTLKTAVAAAVAVAEKPRVADRIKRMDRIVGRCRRRSRRMGLMGLMGLIGPMERRAEKAGERVGVGERERWASEWRR
jgi:hypothetical protein